MWGDPAPGSTAYSRCVHGCKWTRSAPSPADAWDSSFRKKTCHSRLRIVAKKETVIQIEGKTLKLSNLEKVLYPAVGFTKGQVIDYFVRIAPVLLPTLKDRPLTLKR